MAKLPAVYLGDPTSVTQEELSAISDAGHPGAQAGVAVVAGALLAAIPPAASWLVRLAVFLVAGAFVYAIAFKVERWLRYHLVAPRIALERRLVEAQETIRRFTYPKILETLAEDLLWADALSVRHITSDEELDRLRRDHRAWRLRTKEHIALKSASAAARFASNVRIKGAVGGVYNDDHRTIWLALQQRTERLRKLIERWEAEHEKG